MLLEHLWKLYLLLRSTQNHLVVGHVGGRLAETDLSNLIKSLWSRAEESSEEILCLTGCSARMLFLSLSRAVVEQTVSAHIHQTAGTVVLLKRDLEAETLSGGVKTRLEDPQETVLTAGLCRFHVSEVGREGVNAHSGSLLR